jgi:hypothetical protein
MSLGEQIFLVIGTLLVVTALGKFIKLLWSGAIADDANSGGGHGGVF